MKGLKLKVSCLILAIFFSAGTAIASTPGTFSTTPVTNQGDKWRIGYYEGGDYKRYQEVLIATIKGLMQLGWIEQSLIPEGKVGQTKELWEWLATKAKSDYLVFVADGHYNAHWDDGKREKTASILIKRLTQKKDIDLMIAMGTWAGQDLANNSHTTDTEVISASDPVGSGIINSIKDSGFDHLHAQIDPYRYEKQVRVFHEMTGFKNLGICYEDSEAGRTYAAIDKVEKMAKERGFNIIRSYTKSDVADMRIAEESVKKSFAELVKKSDAIFVTMQGGVNSKTISELVSIANKHQIPTFSQSGSEEVKYGVLASISRAGFKYIGEYHAEIIAMILSGATPRQLPQLFEEPPKIAINLKTAEEIGFDPPVDILLAADEIYNEIALPPSE
ncbi:MAG: ABC transporter substrate-binding protein [Desulfobulbaceae bacterium]|nr:ABC transporter substrate-binding protein [Desulfobulbaceae bacterium]